MECRSGASWFRTNSFDQTPGTKARKDVNARFFTKAPGLFNPLRLVLRHGHGTNGRSRVFRPGLCMEERSQRLDAAKQSVTTVIAMVAVMGTMAVRASVAPVIVTVAVRTIVVPVSISIDYGSAWRSHDHWRSTIARCYHDGRGVTKYHPRQRWEREANVDVDTCLRGCSRSEKNRCEHCEFFHTPYSTGNAPVWFGVLAVFSNIFVE